jgi:hypothetical protein
MVRLLVLKMRTLRVTVRKPVKTVSKFTVSVEKRNGLPGEGSKSSSLGVQKPKARNPQSKANLAKPCQRVKNGL